MDDWNAGYQHFVEGGDAFGCARKSAAWNAGFRQAQEDMDNEVAAAERECLADYDNGPGRASFRRAR